MDQDVETKVEDRMVAMLAGRGGGNCDLGKYNGQWQ